jgi:hypothetical protein
LGGAALVSSATVSVGPNERAIVRDSCFIQRTLRVPAPLGFETDLL